MNMQKLKLSLAGVVGCLALSTPAYADGGLTFLITGDTFDNPYSISNSSTAGENVVGFGVKLISPFGFDTVDGGFGVDASAAFAVQGGSGGTTGYSGPAAFGDGVNQIDFTFSDFGVGETFTWGIDVDRPFEATVFANELIGSTGYADFSNGLRGLGVFEAISGDPNGTQFVIKTFTPTPSVPEPGAWAMMLIGFGAVGSLIRRQSRRAVSVLA